MKKILITGSSGTLGSYLSKLFPDAYCANHRKLDVTNPDHVRVQLKHHEPDIIIHCAAETSLEKCEKDPIKAIKVNSFPLVYLTQYAKPDATIIYISTASVFGTRGGQMPSEDDTDISPGNHYALSKYYGELFLKWNRKEKQRIIIVRPGWIFGKGGAKFVEQIMPKLKENKPVLAVDDIRGNPTYAKDFAEFLKVLVDNVDNLHDDEVFHFTNQDTASRVDMANKVKEIIGSDSQIIPVQDSYFNSPVVRPKREFLSMEYTMERIPYSYRTWQWALTDYVHEIEKTNKS